MSNFLRARTLRVLLLVLIIYNRTVRFQILRKFIFCLILTKIACKKKRKKNHTTIKIHDKKKDIHKFFKFFFQIFIIKSPICVRLPRSDPIRSPPHASKWALFLDQSESSKISGWGHQNHRFSYFSRRICPRTTSGGFHFYPRMFQNLHS